MLTNYRACGLSLKRELSVVYQRDDNKVFIVTKKGGLHNSPARLLCQHLIVASSNEIMYLSLCVSVSVCHQVGLLKSLFVAVSGEWAKFGQETLLRT